MAEWFVPPREGKALEEDIVKEEGVSLVSGGSRQTQGEKSLAEELRRTSKRVTDNVNRITPLNLLKLYLMEPLLYSGVNIYIKEVASSFKLVCEDEEALKHIQKFVDKVNLPEKLRRIVWDLCVYGNSFLEKIPYEDNPIEDLVPIDSKSMNFLKDKNGAILEDKVGKPLGYWQQHSNPTDVSGRLGEICSNGGVSPDDVEIFTGIPFARSDIIHFRLNVLSDSDMGLGLIEPLYDTVMLKLKVEEALGKAVQRVGIPQHIVYLGTPDHRKVSGAEKEAVDRVLANAEAQDYFTFPWYIKLDTTRVERIEKLHEYLEYWVDQICSGLGIPHSVLLRGERIGSGVADTHEDQLQKNILSFQDIIARTIEQEIFKPLCRGYRSVPKIIWKRVSLLQTTKILESIGALSRAGQLTPDRATEQWLRELLDMPGIEKESSDEQETREKLRFELIRKNKDS